eukprot:TRINITY_DN14290_c0_g1_i1.p1 TRINITY_DN14290_c0_g1~~TRINITY_DN14290_c0_g1_i1.p1  ORF type:complete len:475 (+),score=205.15 TRINITY_DN14290_c0_g1_i1:83-1507(+)
MRSSAPLGAALLVLLLSAPAARADGDQAQAEFNAWFHALSPAVNSALSVKHFDGMGRGFVAERDFKTGDRIMEVPMEWVVTKDAVLGRAAGDELRAYRHVSEQSHCLALWLLTERRKGPASRWHLWLRVLPQSFDAPVFYTEEELKGVEGPGVLHDIQRLRQEAADGHAKVMQGLRKLLPKVYTKRVVAEHYSLELWKWAHACLSTRAWHMQGVQYMVPGAGMFNHAMDDEDLRYDWRKDTGHRSQKFLTYHKIEGERAVVLSDRSVRKGEQAFESYGDNRNSIYFNYHGFVPDENPYDCYSYQLPAQAVTGGAEARQAKLDALRAAQFPVRICVHAGEVPEQLLLFFSIAALKDEDAARCSSKRSFSAVAKCAGWAGHKRRALRRLGEALESEAKSVFPSGGPAVDEALLADKGSELSPRATQTVRYRLRLKRLLHGLREAAGELLKQAEAAFARQKKRRAERRSKGSTEGEL